MFDVVRLLAAYCIVWLHTPRSAQLASWTVLGRLAVPFFVGTTIYFVWKGLVEKSDRGFYPYAISRFQRIYLPFLAWSVIYLVFKAGKGIALPDQPNNFPGLEFLWVGSFYHLWFMPFILVVSLAVFLVGRPLVTHRMAEITVAVACVLAGVGVALISLPERLSGTNISLVYAALPAVFWGITLSVLDHRAGRALLRNSTAAVLGLVVSALCMVWLVRFGHNSFAENLGGVSLTIVAQAPWNAAALAWIGQFGPLAYGIYLSHLLFIKTAEALLNKMGLAATWPLDLAVLLLAAVGSTALAWCLSRSRYTRWLAA
jgi:surface polysaccharide O-acyltransferase-like enzyme